jgi:hypothetical protein
MSLARASAIQGKGTLAALLCPRGMSVHLLTRACWAERKRDQGEGGDLGAAFVQRQSGTSTALDWPDTGRAWWARCGAVHGRCPRVRLLLLTATAWAMGAPRQPPGCRRLALGLSRECGWNWDAGGMEGVRTGSGSAVRVVAGLSK